MREYSLGGTRVTRYFHVCGFFNSRDEQFDVLMPFFKEAVIRREKLINIVDPDFIEDHLLRLDEAGIGVGDCRACGQLEVLDWHAAYLEDGHFDQDRMLKTVERVFAQGRKAGYENMRLTGEMGWALKGHPGSEQLIEYEARVNTVLARNEQPAVCIYDTAQLSGNMMMDILRAHPLTLVGGAIHENPFFIEPEALLCELAQRRAARTAPSG